VVEFNCRFGDPEAQPVLARLRTDLVALCAQAARGRLEIERLEFDPRIALGVVVAAGGYPGSYASGEVIGGLDRVGGDLEAAGVKIFHAGTRLDGDRAVTAGGRVLCVVGLGASVSEAARRAYEATALVHWKDHYFRRDIGHRAITREAGNAGP
jgi:phosphoribosylamine--glycine ligase